MRAEIANWDDGAPYLDGAVLLGVLNGVACLMGSHPHRSDAGGAIDSIGQPDGVGPGVVVVGEFAGNSGYPNAIDSIGSQHLFCRLGSGEPPAAGNPGIAVESGGHIELSQQGNEKGRHQNDPVIRVKIVEEIHGFPPDWVT